jgi:hypothetical protein
MISGLSRQKVLYIRIRADCILLKKQFYCRFFEEIIKNFCFPAVLRQGLIKQTYMALAKIKVNLFFPFGLKPGFWGFLFPAINGREIK